MNLVVLTGNLAADPEKTYAGSGMAVTRFRLAVNRPFAKKNEGAQTADFIRITCFDKQAEFVDKYLSKGKKVGVEGRIQTGSYQGKDGNTVWTTDVIANRVEFLESKRDSDDSAGSFGGQFAGPPDMDHTDHMDAPRQSEPPLVPPDFATLDDDGDDMPF